jgi:hypothetical protein
MPQIKQYDAPDGLGLRPTETGINATAGAARRVQSEYNEAAAAITGTGQRLGSAISAAGEVAVKYIDNQEISAGAKHGADVVAELDKDWNETSKQADPNDSSVAAKWREEKLEPTLQQFRDSFTTENSQKWAEQFVDRYRQHAFVKTAADMSSKAADAVHVNTLGTINGLAIAAYNDPSSLDFARGALKHALDGIVGSSPNLTSAQSSRVTTELTFKGEQEIVRAAVVGTIVRGGDWRALANDPKNSPYIKQTQMEEFARGAKAQQRTDLLTKKQLETSQRQDDVRAAHSQANKIMADNVAIDPATGRPTIKPEFFQQSLDLVKMRNAPDGLGRTMLDWGEKQQQKDEVIHTDPAVKQELTDRMFNEDKPTTRLDLMRAQVQGKLSHQDYVAMERLTTELDQSPLKGPAWRDTMAAVKGTLTYTMPGLPGKDPKGAENYAKFVQVADLESNGALQADGKAID